MDLMEIDIRTEYSNLMAGNLDLNIELNEFKIINWIYSKECMLQDIYVTALLSKKYTTIIWRDQHTEKSKLNRSNSNIWL